MGWFTDDSYIQYGKKSIFNIKKHSNVHYMSFTFRTSDKMLSFYIHKGSLLKDKDWVAIFNEGDDFTRENILAWKYVDHQDTTLWKDGYEAIKRDPMNKVLVLFSDDTYQVLSKAKVNIFSW